MRDRAKLIELLEAELPHLRDTQEDVRAKIGSPEWYRVTNAKTNCLNLLAYLMEEERDQPQDPR